MHRSIGSAVLAVAAGALAACGGAPPNAAPADPHAAHHAATSSAAATATDERGAILYYRHPHRPDVTSPTPRQDEMGMDYLPVYGAPGGEVAIAPGLQQALGVRTAVAEAGPLLRTIEAPVTAAFDTRGAREVRVRTEGWVESLRVAAAGERVRTGQPLFTVYAPRLAITQDDLARARALQDPELIAAAEARLRALGARAGGSGRVVYVAPVDGVVAELAVAQGAYLTPDTIVARIVPTSRLWIVAAVPEALAAGVSAGATVELRFAALPGVVTRARIGELLPELHAATRTLQARLTLEQPPAGLRAGMTGIARIALAGADAAVTVPLDAVIRTGRGDRVVVVLPGDRFASREVVAGEESGERIAILQGVVAGERVVVAGQFLIDSESSVRASLARLPADGHAP